MCNLVKNKNYLLNKYIKKSPYTLNNKFILLLTFYAHFLHCFSQYMPSYCPPYSVHVYIKCKTSELIHF